jgi:hypothetical protein
MAYEDALTVVASAARTTTGNSNPVRASNPASNLSLLVDVTAVSGTPNLVLEVQWSMDGTVFASTDTPDVFAAITTATPKLKTFPMRAPFYRLVWTITGGTPSLTFSIARYLTG